MNKSSGDPYTAAGNANSQRVMTKLGMTRDPADDFLHPLMAPDDPLRRQVLYRLPAAVWKRGGGASSPG